MTKPSEVTANRANYVTADHCGQRRRALRLNAVVMQKSRDVFPIKTAHHLADITGYSLRTCEYWLSEKVVIPSDALAALLKSEWGRSYLAEVMAGSTPRWWTQLRAWFDSIDYAAAAKKLQRKRRELLEQVVEYAPANSFAQMLFDEDFNGAHVAPTSRLRRPVDTKGTGR